MLLYKPRHQNDQWYAVLFDEQRRRLRAVPCSSHAETLRFCTMENAQIRSERVARKQVAHKAERDATAVDRLIAFGRAALQAKTEDTT